MHSLSFYFKKFHIWQVILQVTIAALQMYVRSCPCEKIKCFTKDNINQRNLIWLIHLMGMTCLKKILVQKLAPSCTCCVHGSTWLSLTGYDGVVMPFHRDWILIEYDPKFRSYFITAQPEPEVPILNAISECYNRVSFFCFTQEEGVDRCFWLGRSCLVWQRYHSPCIFSKS